MWGFIAALVAGIFSYAAATSSTNHNNKNIDKSLKAQSDENEKTREYNLQLAEKQNQWNVEQWNRENAYNSPAKQVERLVEAGINPLWAMSGGDFGNAQHYLERCELVLWCGLFAHRRWSTKRCFALYLCGDHRFYRRFDEPLHE